MSETGEGPGEYPGEDLRERLRHGSWVAGVIGLGYVGLPLAVTAVQRGLDCVGFDVSEAVVDRLATGVSTTGDVSAEELKDALDRGLRVTTDEQALSEADVIFVCVPSPLGRNRQPDLSYIDAAAQTLGRVTRPGQLVVLESTSYPGTTEEHIVPHVVRDGLALDEDVFVAFSPERVDPGNPRKLADIPKVVGGVSPRSTEMAVAAYERLVPHVHPVSSARAAELTKLLENIYRAVNIGLVNELAQLAHALDIDVWEVIDAAATKPFGFQAFYPGPGVGGHCIPLDPQFLAWRAREAKFATRFIDLSEQVNTAMPEYTAGRIADVLNSQGLAALGAEVLAVGIAYKPNVADDRESPALDVLDELRRRGSVISVWDPHVPDERVIAHGYTPVDGDVDDLGRFAIAVVLTDHDAFDLERIASEVPVVFDARGAYRNAKFGFDNVVAL